MALVMIDPFAVPYTLKLCDAIERFTAVAIAQDRRSFDYRGTDLRYAVERLLYFALVNDQGLYERFARGTNRCGMEPTDELSPVAKLLAPYLVDEAHAPERVPGPGRLRSVVAALLTRRKPASQPVKWREEGLGPAKSTILFLVIQPKFVTFLLPVAEALGLPYAFLVIDDPPLYEHLAARALPRIIVNTPAGARPCAVLPPGLVDFAGLAATYDALTEMIGSLQPRGIVVPEGNAPVNEVASRAAHAHGLPVLCVQQGWSPIVHNGFRNMSYNRMCVWGEGFAELLRPYNRCQPFAITGNHMVRLRPPAEAPGRRAIGFFLQKGSRLISEGGWRGCLDLIRWSAVQFPEMEIRVREHPSVPLSPAEQAFITGSVNVRIMGPATHALDDVLAGCRIAVSVFSTTILEAAAAGAVPLILNITGLPHYHPDIASAGAAVEVKDFADARGALTSLMRSDEAIAPFASALEATQRRFFAKDRGAALRAIAAEIAALAG